MRIHTMTLSNVPSHEDPISIQVITAGYAAENSDLMSIIIDAVQHGTSRIITDGAILWTGGIFGISPLLTKLKSTVRPGMEIQVQKKMNNLWNTIHKAIVQ